MRLCAATLRDAWRLSEPLGPTDEGRRLVLELCLLQTQLALLQRDDWLEQLRGMTPG